MPGSKSDYLENKLLDHTLRGTVFTPPSTLYLALYTVAPTDAGGGTEVSGGAYSRQVITFDAAVGGATANSAQIVFSQATSSWGTIVAFGIFDTTPGGNLLYWGDISPNKTVDNLDTARFAAGDLDITED